MIEVFEVKNIFDKLFVLSAIWFNSTFIILRVAKSYRRKKLQSNTCDIIECCQENCREKEFSLHRWLFMGLRLFFSKLTLFFSLQCWCVHDCWFILVLSLYIFCVLETGSHDVWSTGERFKTVRVSNLWLRWAYFIPALYTFLGLGIDPLSVLLSLDHSITSMLVIKLTNWRVSFIFFVAVLTAQDLSTFHGCQLYAFVQS